ncbi:Ig domain-containing protein [Paenibacillus sp. D51F]
MSYRVTNRSLLSLLLAAVLALALLAPAAHAEDTVTSVALTEGSKLSLTYGDDPYALALWASYSGSSATKDVSASAVWSTSSSSVLKVTGGVLTPAAAGTATITGKYSGYSASISVTVTYPYAKLQLLAEDGSAAPSTLKVQLGDDLTFGVVGKNGNESKDLADEAAWSSSNTAAATVEDGKVTLVAAGTSVIKASYRGVSASISLTVSSPYQSLALSPNSLIDLTAGDEAKSLTATASPAGGGTPVDVTMDASWTTSAAAVAKVDKGVVTPVGPGTATITASLYGSSATVRIVVRAAHEALKLSASAELNLLLSDNPLQVTASALDPNKEPADVTKTAEWSSSEVFTATVADGLVTPKAAGSSVIKVEYKGLSRTLNVTVYPTILSIEAGSESLTSIAGDSGQLPTVTGKTLDDSTIAVDKLVSWTSGDSDIIVIKDGKWSAKKAGKAVLKAAVGGLSAEVEMVVSLKPLALLPEQQTISLVIGKDTPIPSLNVTYTDGTEEDVTAKAEWKTTGSSLLVKGTTLRGLTAARTSLTASYQGKTVSLPVVIEEELTKLVAEESSIVLNPGKSKTVKVTGTFKSGSTSSLASKMTWTVDNDDIASFKGSSIKGLKLGTAKLTGTYQGKSITLTIAVKPKLKSLVLSDKTLQLAPGASAPLKLKAFYDNGTQAEVTAGAVWTSSKEAAATVSTGGAVTATAKGTATIKAAFEGKTVSVRVTVK